MLQDLNHFVQTFNRFLVNSTASDPRMKKESFSDYVRYTGPGAVYYDNTLYSPHLKRQGDDLEKLVDEQIAYFTPQKKNFEWKVYGFNQLTELEEILIQKGFKVERKSTVMFAPVNIQVKSKGDFQLIHAKEWNDFQKIVEIQENVYGKNAGDFLKDLQNEALLANSRLDVYVAEQNKKALSAAWIRHYGEISFFFGGATLKEARGLGAYSSLVQKRLDCAKARGSIYAVSECSKDSEAVLTKVGFHNAGSVNVFVHAYI